jgi:hypothetical protein
VTSKKFWKNHRKLQKEGWKYEINQNQKLDLRDPLKAFSKDTGKIVNNSQSITNFNHAAPSVSNLFVTTHSNFQEEL